MKKGYYKIAGKVVEINSLHNQVHSLCRDYSVDATAPDITLHIDQEDINRERLKSEKEDQLEGIPQRTFPDSLLETTAVYRKLVNELLPSDFILFHGSAVAVEGHAYLFTAKSGTGKSTHVRLWKRLFGDQAVVVNDDKPLLHISDEQVMVYGTPWCGKHHLNTNTAVPLKAICILERGEKNNISPCEFSDVFPLLLQQTYKPEKAEEMVRTMKLLVLLSQNVRFYRLRCNMEPEAAVVAWNGMRQEMPGAEEESWNQISKSRDK